MNNTATLYQLILSMTKTEKRFFKVQSQQFNRNEQLQYITLFDILDQKVFDKEQLDKKIKNALPKKNISKLTKYLVDNICTSLLLYHKKKIKSIDQYEQLSFVKVLIKKSQFDLARQKLLKLKKEATENEDLLLLLSINEGLVYLNAKCGQLSPKLQKENETYFEESLNYVDLLQLQTRLSFLKYKVLQIIYSKEKNPKLIEASLTQILKKDLEPLRDSLKISVIQYEYYAILSLIYIAIKDKQKNIETLEKIKKITTTPPFKDSLDTKCGIYANLVIFYASDPHSNRYHNTMSEFIDLLNKHPEQKTTYLYWRYIGEIEFYYHHDHINPPDSFFKELDTDLANPNIKMDKHHQHGLLASLATYFFKMNLYTKALDTVLRIHLTDKITLENFFYIETMVIEILCYYETQNIQLAKSKALSLKRKLTKNDAAHPLLKEAASILLRYFNNEKSEQKYLELLAQLFKQEEDYNVNFYDLTILQMWVSRKINA